MDLRKYKNREDDAHFEFQYSFKEAYKLRDMTIRGGITDFYDKMTNSEEVQKTYSFFKSSELQPGHVGKDVSCDIMTSETRYAECLGN